MKVNIIGIDRHSFTLLAFTLLANVVIPHLLKMWNDLPCTVYGTGMLDGFIIIIIRGGRQQGKLTVNNRYTHRKFKLKFSALLKDYDLKYAENTKK